MLQTYVSPPRPIEVKKLMENRVFLGLSRGSKPSNARERSLEKEGIERVILSRYCGFLLL